ncbi:helix-turn-helix transcriptional regulator [Candidatus Latescibacterota bacterium]
MNEQVKYIKEKEVAEITGRALSTLRNERFLGKGIPYIKIGKSVRYKIDDVINFMESNRVETLGI